MNQEKPPVCVLRYKTTKKCQYYALIYLYNKPWGQQSTPQGRVIPCAVVISKSTRILFWYTISGAKHVAYLPPATQWCRCRLQHSTLLSNASKKCNVWLYSCFLGCYRYNYTSCTTAGTVVFSANHMHQTLKCQYTCGWNYESRVATIWIIY